MNNRKKWLGVLTVFVGIAICVMFFRWFTVKETEYLNKICRDQMQSYAQENVAAIRSELLNALNGIAVASSTLEDEKIEPSNSTINTLRVIKSNTSFSQIYISDLRGKAFSNTGSVANLAQRDFFKRTIRGEESIVYNKGDDGVENITVSSPIIRKGKIVGSMHGKLEVYPLYKIMNSNKFNGLGYASLVTAAGRYIVSSDSSHELNKNRDNLFNWLSEVEMDNHMNIQNIRSDMQKNQSGIITLNKGEAFRQLYYVPIGINNWYLVQQVSSEYIDNLYKTTRHNVLVLVLELCAWLLVIMTAVALYVRKAHRLQVESTRKFTALTNNIPGGVAEVELYDDFRIRYANDGFYALTGYSREEFDRLSEHGSIISILTAGDALDVMSRAEKQTQYGNRISLSYRICKKNGDLCWLNTEGTVIEKNKKGAVIQAIITDVTLDKMQTAQIVDSSKRDKMTKLYDKVSSKELIEHMLQNNFNNSINVFMIIDIDNFKHVNDTYGHQEGDAVIIAVAELLSTHFRNTDIKGRVGGDEFIVCLYNVPSFEFAEKKVALLQDKIKLIRMAGIAGQVSCSIGGVMLPPSVQCRYDEAFAAADNNLYAVKESVKGGTRFTVMTGAPDNSQGEGVK